MIQNVTKNYFHDQFNSIRPDNFSYEGLNTLYDYLVELEESCDMQIELDVIAICGDFSEYKIDEALEYYQADDIDELKHNTSVIEIPNTERIILQCY
jgi:hypothetical protein